MVIEGGQTMNPSTEDILKAVEQASADTVYVLPNIKILFWQQNRRRSFQRTARLWLFRQRRFLRESRP